MKTEQIIILVVSFFLGMLLLNMVKNTCGCELKEGFSQDPDTGAKAAEWAKTLDCGEGAPTLAASLKDNYSVFNGRACGVQDPRAMRAVHLPWNQKNIAKLDQTGCSEITNILKDPTKCPNCSGLPWGNDISSWSLDKQTQLFAGCSADVGGGQGGGGGSGCGWSGTSDYDMLPVEVEWDERGRPGSTNGAPVEVVPFIERCSGQVPGQVTYRLYIKSTSNHLNNVYTVYGDQLYPLTLPAAVQVPLGVPSYGRFDAALEAAYLATGASKENLSLGSWLTVAAGESGRRAESTITSIGVDWDTWTESDGLTVDDGAVFHMNPDDGPKFDNGGVALLAQITISDATTTIVSMSVQGQPSGRKGGSWRAHLEFSLAPPNQSGANPDSTSQLR